MAIVGFFIGVQKVLRRSKLARLALIALILCAIYILYRNDKYTFSTVNESYRHSQKDTENSQAGKKGNLLSLSQNAYKNTDIDIDVIITFTNAERNYNLQQKFRTTVQSMLRFSSIPVNLHILGDEHSEQVATKILSEVADKAKYRIVHENVKELSEEVESIISQMQAFFSYKPGAYYSDAFFFLSIIGHRAFPHLDRVIMLDCDLKFNADLKDLYSLFEDFSSENVIGIGRELQPTYRHVLHQYRRQNKGSRAGGPSPDGLSGFNSGVLLLDLDKMRRSTLYNSLINEDAVGSLTKKYMFKGHLGDQDFFSLISFDHEELFYTVPCTWNRQLCQWWRNNGYFDVFDQYFVCDGHINIYHGNCNTEIPKLDWES